MPRIFGVYLFVLMKMCSGGKLCNLNQKSVNCSNGHYDQFTGYKEVDILYFRNNSLRDLEVLSKIDVSLLYVEWNKIQSLSDSFQCLRGLKQLHLANNEVEEIHKTAFLGMVNLTILILSHNKVRFIDRDAFVDSRNLQKVFLDDNRIVDLGFVKHLSGVKYLNLSNNQISSVDEFVGARLVNLTVLDLSYNYITAVQMDQFSNLAAIVSVLLQNNPNLEGCCPITRVRRGYNTSTRWIEYSLNSVVLCCHFEQNLPSFEACGVNCSILSSHSHSPSEEPPKEFKLWIFGGVLIASFATVVIIAVPKTDSNLHLLVTNTIPVLQEKLKPTIVS